MIVHSWCLWVIGIIIAAVLCYLIDRWLEKGSDKTSSVGCLSFFVLGWAIPLILKSMCTTVIVISDNGEELEESSVLVCFSYNGHSISLWSGDYIDNQTDETLELYPVYYGVSRSLQSKLDKQQIIKPNSFAKLSHIPDYYFYEPNTVYDKSSKKQVCRWILDTQTNKIKNSQRMPWEY